MGEKLVLIFLGVAALTSAIFIAQEECPPNEEYLLCGSACPFNCTDPEGPVVCSTDCVEGCFCKSGFLRNENGTCVAQDQCVSSKSPSTEVCEPNEEFLSCGTACPRTCTQPDPLVCGIACSMGCFCKSGYVRDVAKNACVTLDQCPAEPCFNNNKVYDVCNGACEPSCSDPEPICTNICSGGCVCASGFLRDDSGECVTVDKCPASNSTEPGVLAKYMDTINKILHLSNTA